MLSKPPRRTYNRYSSNSKYPETDTNEELAMEISELLGGLPLLINQAGRFIKLSNCSLESILITFVPPAFSYGITMRVLAGDTTCGADSL